jgi:glutathione-regulated potassium-efflux system ancillary protein KefG
MSTMVPPKVDPDDLIDSAEVAELLGLAHREAISTYRGRYDDFPEPVVTKARCLLWHRPAVERWKRAHPGRRS